jgi:hypothetical protein
VIEESTDRRFIQHAGKEKVKVVKADPVPSPSSAVSSYLSKLGYVDTAAWVDAMGESVDAAVTKMGQIARDQLAPSALMSGAKHFAPSGFLGPMADEFVSQHDMLSADSTTYAYIRKHNPQSPFLPENRGGAVPRGRPTGGEGNFSGQLGKWWTPERVQQGIDYLQKEAGLPEVSARALVARWAAVEAPGGPLSKGGYRGRAVGIAQWLGSRKAAGVPETYEGQLAKVVGELKGPEAAAYRALLNARTEEEGAWAAHLYERAEAPYTKPTLEAMRRIKSGDFTGPGLTPGGGLYGGAGATGQIPSFGAPPLAPGQAPNVVEQQGTAAATRTLPIGESTRGWLQAAAESTGLTPVVTSGGQPPPGMGRRTGTTRHDVGGGRTGAADLHLLDEKGRKLDMRLPNDRRRMAEFVAASVSAGASGVGAGLGYMGAHTIHIGGGKANTWGGAGWVREAWAQGMQYRRNPPPPKETAASVAAHNAKMTGHKGEETPAAVTGDKSIKPVVPK